jgi:hypothetical protein
MQLTIDELRAALGEVQTDKERLSRRLEALQRRTADRNPLCRGCEDWRRFIATMAGVGWLIWLLTIFHKVAVNQPERVADVKAPFPGPELVLLAQAIASGEPDKLAIIFVGVLGPYLGVLAHWNWLLWRNGQPTMPERMVEALRGLWQRLRVRLTPHRDQH